MTILDVARTATGNDAGSWTPVCSLTDLIPGRGVAALVDDEQVALFLLGYDEDGPILRAVGNIDPFGRAAVMSRGLIGSRGEVPTVASPLLKQVFSLDTGICLDDESQGLPVYPVRVEDGLIAISGRAERT
jgi:nitrite reductase (NADH) small subunit